MLAATRNRVIEARVGSKLLNSLSMSCRKASDFLNWTPMLTNTTSLSGIFDFTDASAGANAKRFYRAVATP